MFGQAHGHGSSHIGKGSDNVLTGSTLIHLQIHINTDLTSSTRPFIVQNLGPHKEKIHVYLSPTENTSYLEVWKYLTHFVYQLQKLFPSGQKRREPHE